MIKIEYVELVILSANGFTRFKLQPPHYVHMNPVPDSSVMYRDRHLPYYICVSSAYLTTLAHQQPCAYHSIRTGLRHTI